LILFINDQTPEYKTIVESEGFIIFLKEV